MSAQHIVNLSRDYDLDLMDRHYIPGDALYAALVKHPILSTFPRLAELKGIMPLKFYPWIAEFQAFAERHRIMIYVD